jgi:urease beta subunit
MQPGEYLIEDGDIEANVGRATARITVRHTGDRPIQVGSHFHAFEINRALEFDRAAAYGMRFNIPAGTAVRFEPGDEREVDLVAFGGGRIVWGHRGLVNGALDDPAIRAAAIGEQP